MEIQTLDAKDFIEMLMGGGDDLSPGDAVRLAKDDGALNDMGIFRGAVGTVVANLPTGKVKVNFIGWGKHDVDPDILSTE